MIKTTYRGYYIDIRDGIRVGVTFTYQMKSHKGMINEKEISIVKL
jgi:hypothetical protein